MRLGLRRAAPALLSLALLSWACSREQVRSRPATPAKLAALPAYESPASWRYHPHVVAAMRARAELVPGRVLFAGARGERWLLDTGAGRLESAVPAPEDLVAILSGPGSGYSFVGKSGATYRADEPLGRFVASTVPFEPLAEVAGSLRVLFAVRRDRKLVRSLDAGASFSPVGPEGIAFVDVETDARGNALALAHPEALWKSSDGGVTWQPLDAPTHGAVGLERDLATSSIRVLTVLGPLLLDANGALVRGAQTTSSDAFPKTIRPLAGPNAGAFAEGRATWAGPGYAEARSSDSRSALWSLLRGPLRGPLVATPLAEAKGCRAVRLAGFENFLRLACFRGSPDVTQEVELFASSDAGATFVRDKVDLYARLADFRMAVGAGGAWLVTGGCPPSTQAPGCAPSGILHLRQALRPATLAGVPDAGAQAPSTTAKPRFELAVSAAPGLADSALSLAFGVDGKTAFAAARTTKGAGLALYASTDGGKTFEPRDIGGRFDSSDEAVGRVTLSAATDGTLALVAARGTSASLFVADDRGRVISASSPPEAALVGAAGLSAIAVAPDGRVFESLDGGAAWEPAGSLPAALCDDSGCDVPIACGTSGCVVGDELTRVGWGTSDLPEIGAARSPGRSLRSGASSRLRTPIACALSAGAFRPLAGVHDLPAVEQIALGDAAWFAIGVDAASASAVIHQARGGARPRLDLVTLLGPVPDASRYALAVMDQIEGGAALRYPVPDMRAGARLRDVEVAWQNFFERRLVRTRVADGGEYVPGDFARVDSERRAGAQAADPELMSIGERGFYLRLHASPMKKTQAGSRQATLFLDGKSVQTLPPLAYPPTIVAGGMDEMAHVGDAHVALYYLSPGPSVVRATLDKNAWRFDAMTVGLPNPRAFGLEQVVRTTYVGGRAAFHLEWADPVLGTAEARVFALRADGALVEPALSVPTQRDLAERPAACSAAVREASPRVIGRALPGTRHPVVVSDPVDPPRAMLTGDAVLHGTSEAPCAAGFEVSVVRASAERGADERGVVLLDDLEHAWLLRRVDAPDGGFARVEYRGMSCRFEPGLEIPDELLGEPAVGDADR